MEKVSILLASLFRERVDYEDPSTYDDAAKVARAKSRKMKKKMEAGLLQSTITVASGPRPKQIEEHQKVKAHFLDMHLIKEHEADARLEKVEEVPIRSQKIWRGIFRVPPSLLPQEDEVIEDRKEEVLALEPATRQTTKVREPVRLEEESESSHSSTRSLDMDATWETESRSSRYEIYDVFHVDEVEKYVCELPASQLNVEEKYSVAPCVNLRVEQPYQMSCDGERGMV
ncbi:hypothetical protein GOP47_0004561 [Adiantum capillus-veneris]|uniref:Uncharacterized protein n=1 Tax=Adiantum capillus-veneris TaxID=13818 RepID=A0A9D4V933_ADICA|nr:hypothetical protein GOP47_0004561 [Adiantum capillus-veneris]